MIFDVNPSYYKAQAIIEVQSVPSICLIPAQPTAEVVNNLSLQASYGGNKQFEVNKIAPGK